MKSIYKLFAVTPVLLLTSCANVGQTASWSENMSDSFMFTSASAVPAGKTQCVSLAQPYVLKSGDATFNLPAGVYKGTSKNSSGVYYYAPSSITTSVSHWVFSFSNDGVFFNNSMTAGNLFGAKLNGYDRRPVRTVVLPGSVISRFKKIGRC